MGGFIACLYFLIFLKIDLCCFIFSFYFILLFFHLIFFFYYFYFILLYNTVLVSTYIDLNPPRVYMRSQHEPPSHLPPHNIPLGHPHAPAPSMLYPASDIDWWFDSYMIVYMFQCHSPKWSHPLPLPLSPKFTMHICVFFAVLHTESSLPSF